MSHSITRAVLLIIVVTAITLAVSYGEHFNAAALEGWVTDAGAAGPLLFIVIYAIATVLFLPGSVLTLAGGAIFGPYVGTFVNLTGASLGALGSFLIARYLAHDWVMQKSGGRVRTLMNGVENEGWRFVAFVRLVPLFPFNLLNYALGLTPIRMWHYLVATYIFMFPGAVAYTYLGYAGREAIGGGEDLIQKGLLALALLAMVAFLPRLISMMRRRPMLSVEDLKLMVDAEDVIHIVDVRAEQDYRGELGHIHQAVNIPLEELESRLDEIEDHLQDAIAIVCTTDRRSMKAAQIMISHGFVDVHVIRGGMTDWNRHGYPTQS